MVRQAPTSAGDDTATSDIATLGESFARHLRAAHKSPATIRSYLDAIGKLEAFLADTGMPRQVASIRREHVESFIEDQLARLKPASAANRYRSLQQFFRWLVDEDEIRDSPMARTKPPAVAETPPPVLTPDQLGRLLRACAGPDFESRRDLAIISLLIDTGIRRAELAGLTVDSIEFPQATRRDSSVGGFATVLGKGDRPRTVAFNTKTSAELDRYLRTRAKHPHARTPWLWLGKKGRLGDSGVAQMLRRRAHEAGIGEIHPHLFRHTFAHQWLAGGGSEGDLMMLAGWRSRTMLQRYGKSAAMERAHAAHAKHSPRDRL
jgi:site-specific recombinase XerD